MTPLASGTLADTPLAHGLIYARNRRLSGRLELVVGDGRSAAIALWHGRITAVEVVPVGMCPGGFFGGIVYELGFIDSAVMNETLLEISKTKRLHGEVLIGRKAITSAQRDEALVEQVHRKVHHLFTLPESTSYAFYDAKAAPTADPPVAVDPLGPVWRGIRDYPPAKFVAETVRRIGENALRATTGGAALLPPAETTLIQTLATRPMTLEEMKASSELPGSRVELLAYLLVIAKCVEAVSGARTHPSTGALPTNMPSGPVRVSGENRLVSGAIRVAPPSSSKIPIRTTSSMKFPAVNGVRPAPSAEADLRTPAEMGIDAIVARAATVTDENYFVVLGIADGGSAEAARAAFMRLAKSWHSDRVPPEFNSVRLEIAKIFSHMSRAQKVLCDADARRTYLGERKSKAPVRPRKDVLRDVTLATSRRDFDAAVELCQSLVDQNPEDAEASALQAWASVHNGEASEEDLRLVLTRLDRAVNTDRSCDQAVYIRGLVHKRLNNVPAAFRDFSRALQLNPRHLDAEREVRIFAMRARKGSGEHKMSLPSLDKIIKK